MVTFHRATIARMLRPMTKGESPEAVMLTAFSFWHPFDESLLIGKLRERLDAGDFAGFEEFFIGKGQSAYEEEEVDSSEAVGLGFYRWGIISPDGDEIVRLNKKWWIWNSAGKEKIWRPSFKQLEKMTIKELTDLQRKINIERYVYGG